MKRTILFIVLALIVNIPAIYSQDYDHAELSPSGDLLLYTIDSCNNATVVGRSNLMSNANPYINLIIPTHITYNGNNVPVRAIGRNAFREDYELVSVDIPQTVKTIEQYAFYNCESMGTIHIPSTVTTIGQGAFGRIPNVDYHGPAQNSGDEGTWGAFFRNGYLVDGWCFVDSTMTYLIHADRGITKYSIPETVEEVLHSAFNGTMVDTLFIDSENQFSGEFLFKNCFNLKTVFYNNPSFFYNNGGRFSNCRNLTEFRIGEQVTRLDYAICSNCVSLTELFIPNNVGEVHPYAFAGCVNLRTLHIGDGVYCILWHSFEDCTSLRNLYIGNKVSRIGESCFTGCDSLRHIVLPQSVESISSSFGGCHYIESITCMARIPPIINNNNDTAFCDASPDIPIYVPCGRDSLYSESWPMFHNYVQIPFYVEVSSEDDNKGEAELTDSPLCNHRYATVEAFPRQGYVFSHWSDGETQNPYTFHADNRESVYLTAFFESNSAVDALEKTIGMRVYVKYGGIIVESDVQSSVDVYDIHGRRIYHTDTASTSLDIAVPATGIYIVRNALGMVRKCVVAR